MAKEIQPTETSNERFAFDKRNYQFLLIGIAVLIVGYLLMIGGGSENPKEFDPAIFSFRRITLAPIIVTFGYVVIFYAILLKPKANR